MNMMRFAKRALTCAVIPLIATLACCQLASVSGDGLSDDDGWERPAGDKSVFNTNPTGKRGLCYNHLNAAEAAALKGTKSQSDAEANSLCWVYNWALPSDDAEYARLKANGIEFVPMAWGATFSEADLRAFYKAHPECNYLLGFNEPMMTGKDGGCAMTPEQAANLWPRLEALADEFGLKLVSPALTYGYEKVGGTVYGTPEAWMDAFIKAYQKKHGKDPRFDYLALHCYMNWPEAMEGYCKRYAEMYGKQVWLTEFCAWEYDNGGQNESMEAQTKSMQEKVAWLDKSSYVARYAWFMSHGNKDSIPYNSIFVADNKTKDGDGSLTDLGKAYLAR